MNPDAPELILAGEGIRVQRVAQALCKQDEPIPVFMKRKVNEWEYLGIYRVDRCTNSPQEIEKRAQKQGARTFYGSFI